MRLAIRYSNGETEIIDGLDPKSIEHFIAGLESESTWIAFNSPDGTQALFRNSEMSRVHIEPDPPVVDPSEKSAL